MRLPPMSLLLLALLPGGCVAVPPEIKAEFSAPDGTRPNNYHSCRVCAQAAKAGKLKPGGPAPCLAATKP